MIVGQRAEVVPQFPQMLGRRKQTAQDLVVDRESNGPGETFRCMVKNPTWVCSSVGRPKEDDASCGEENISKVILSLMAPIRLSEHLLDDNATEAMDDKKEGSHRVRSTLRLQGNKQVPCDAADRVVSGRRTGPVLDRSIVTECQDTGIRDFRREKVAGPVDRRWQAVGVFLGLGEQIKSTGLDSRLRQALGVGFNVAKTRGPFAVAPCSLRMTSEAMDKDDTCWSACLKVNAPPDDRVTYSNVASLRGTTTVKPVDGISLLFVGAAIVQDGERRP